MNECLLTARTLEALQAHDAQLGTVDVDALMIHLDSDCAECERQLHRFGLDEEALMLWLNALKTPFATEAQTLDGLRARISSTLENRWTSNTTSKRPGFWQALLSRIQGPALGWAAATAGFVLLVALVVVQGGDRQDSKPALVVGEKGAPIEVGLEVGFHWLDATPADRTRIVLTYGIARDAEVELVHRGPNGTWDVMVRGRIARADKAHGRFSEGDGFLGYDLASEPGRHDFLLIVLDGSDAIDVDAAKRLLERDGPCEPKSKTIARNIGHVCIVFEPGTGSGALD